MRQLANRERRVQPPLALRDDDPFEVLQPLSRSFPDSHLYDHGVAGADLVFVDGIRTADDLSEFARRLGDLPRMYNGELPPADVARMGFKVQIHRGAVFSLYPIIKEMMVELRQQGTITALERWGSGGELRMSIANALGLDRITDLERRYSTA